MANELYDLPFKNNSGETIPPFSIMQVDEWTESNDRDYFRVRKPDGNGKTYLFNGPINVAEGHDGWGSRAVGIQASYNISDGTPVVNQEWGPVSGSWLLGSGSGGFYIVGDVAVMGSVNVVRVSPATGSKSAVYEFRNCQDSALGLFLDNPTIASHLPGGENEAAPVAIIRIDGSLGCWLLVGPAPQCATGQCAEIIGWGADCSVCDVSSCFRLTDCGGGSPVIVQGEGWLPHIGKTVVIDAGVGIKCYEVSVATSCLGLNAEVLADDVLSVLDNCSTCGCYEIQNCVTEATMFVTDDLGGPSVVGQVVEIQGKCWLVVDFHSPCEESAPDTLGLTERPDVRGTCSNCCYYLMPCPGQVGSPEPIMVLPSPSDFDLSEVAGTGKVIMLSTYKCYTVLRPANCDGAVEGLPNAVIEVFDSCECCGLTVWKRCGTEDTYIVTYSDLCVYKREGVALKRAEDGFCYEWEPDIENGEGIGPAEFTVEKVYNHNTSACEICQDPRFKLTPNCSGECSDCHGAPAPDEGSVIVTDDEDFYEAVGKFVKIGGQCYFVELTTDALTGTVGECWTGPYQNCGTCAQAPSNMQFVMKVAGEFKLVTIRGSFIVCNTADITEPCEEEA